MKAKLFLLIGLTTVSAAPLNALAAGEVCGYRCTIQVRCADGSVHVAEASGCGFTEYEIQARVQKIAETQTCASHGGRWIGMFDLYCEHIRKPRTDWPHASADVFDAEIAPLIESLE